MKKTATGFGIVVFTVLLLFTGPEVTPCYCDQTEQVKLRIITEDLAPFNFRTEDGKIAGQSTDVVQEILSRLNLNIEIQLMPWNDGYNMALTEPDVALYSTARTAERDNLFQWVGPIGSDEYLFYALKNSDLSLKSLEGTKKVAAIGVVKGDVRHQFLKQNNVSNLKLYPSDVECYQALQIGDVDLVVGSNETMVQMATQAGVDPSEIKPVYSLRKTPLYIAFNKNIAPGFVKKWQDALDEMKGDGTFDKINEQWGGTSAQNVLEVGSQAGISANSASQLLAGLIDIRIHEFFSVLQALTFTDEVRYGKWKKMKPLLVERESAEPAGRIWYLLPDGSYYTTVDDLTSKNLKDRSYFPGLITGKPVIGTIVVSKSTGRPVAVVASPIVKNNKVTGALGTSIYMQDINDEVKKVFPLQKSQMFFVVANDGIISLHSDNEWIGQQASSMNANLKSTLEKSTGKHNFTYEGKNWHAVWTVAPVTGWTVVIATVEK